MSSRRILLSLCLAAACIAGHAADRATRNLHFIERSGSDPAVVFLHGFSQSSVFWKEWVDLLGDRGIHAAAVDMPGFGGSANQPGPYKLESLADAVAEFIEQKKLGPVTLVGSSMGSAVAQFVALRHPKLVGRLVLTATSSGSKPPPPRAGGAPPPPANRGVESQVNAWFIAGKPPAGHAESFYETARQVNPVAESEARASNNSWSTLERLGDIKVPTLIIQGRHDQSKSPEEGELMVKRMRDARLVVLENASHTPQWDEPDAFRAAALPFILEGRSTTRTP